MRFVLILVRVGGVVAFLPLLSDRTAPNLVKIALALVLSVVLFPVVSPTLPSVVWRPVPLLLLGAAEVLFGMLVGLSAGIIFSSVRTGGEIVGRQMGMAMAIGVDPAAGVQVTVVGNFCNAVAVLTFFAINGHHYMLKAIHESFTLWPVGTFISAEMGRSVTVASASHALVLSFQLAAPLLAVTFVLSLVMALMARLARELNVMIFGFALRLLVGLAGLMVFTPLLVCYAGDVARLMTWFMDSIMRGA